MKKIIFLTFCFFVPLILFAQKNVEDVNHDGFVNIGDLTQVAMTILREDNSTIETHHAYSNEHIDSLFYILAQQIDSLKRETQYQKILINSLSDKDRSSNLFNKFTAEVGKFIYGINGAINDVTWGDNIAVSDFIRVNRRDIISNARIGNNVGSYNVYDENKELLRTIINNVQYQFREGDCYVRIAFQDYEKGQANYGTELLDYSEWYDTNVDLHSLNEKVNYLNSVIADILDKGKSTNIYNKETATLHKYIYGKTGGIINADWNETIGVSDYIPVFQRNIISNARIGNGVGSYNVYDSEKRLLRTINNNKHYIYEEGDYFVRIAFDNYATGQANYGDDFLVYESYSDHTIGKDIVADTVLNVNYASITQRVENLESNVTSLIDRNCSSNLYNRNKASKQVYIYGPNGKVLDASWNKSIGVSDYIPVYGRDIISNARIGNGVGSINVYDSNKNLLRTIVNQAQYHYVEGDVYIRIAFDDYATGQANYGSELLKYEEYSEIYSVQSSIYDKYGKPAISWIDDDFLYIQEAYKPIYEELHKWSMENNIRMDFAYIPSYNTAVEKINTSKLREWENEGFHTLMHPYHKGWFDEPAGSYVRDFSMIKSSFVDCISKFEAAGIGTTSIIVYPGNSGDDKDVRNYVKNYVECGICWNNDRGGNHLAERSRYQLRRLNIQLTKDNTKTKIKEAIRAALEKGDWVILGSHVYKFEISDILDETSMTTANLFDIIAYANNLCPLRPTEAIWRERKFLFDIEGK